MSLSTNDIEGTIQVLFRLLEHNPPARAAESIRRILQVIDLPARLLECRERVINGHVRPDDRLWRMTADDDHMHMYIKQRLNTRQRGDVNADSKTGVVPKRAKFLSELVRSQCQL